MTLTQTSHLTTQYLSRGMPLKNSDNKHVHVFHLPFLHSSSSPYAWCLVVLFKILCSTNDCTLFKCTFLYVSIPACCPPYGKIAPLGDCMGTPITCHSCSYPVGMVVFNAKKPMKRTDFSRQFDQPDLNFQKVLYIGWQDVICSICQLIFATIL